MLIDQLKKIIRKPSTEAITYQHLMRGQAQAEPESDHTGGQSNFTDLLSLLGELDVALDCPPRPLANYRHTLAAFDKLLEQFGDTADRLRAVSVSQDNVGATLARQNQPADALALYQASLKIRVLLIQRLGETAGRLNDVIISCNLISSCYPEGSKQQMEWLHKAFLTHQRRTTFYR